jgi:hypothetical protein
MGRSLLYPGAPAPTDQGCEAVENGKAAGYSAYLLGPVGHGYGACELVHPGALANRRSFSNDTTLKQARNHPAIDVNARMVSIRDSD